MQTITIQPCGCGLDLTRWSIAHGRMMPICRERKHGTGYDRCSVPTKQLIPAERQTQCRSCGCLVPSSKHKAFFLYQPDQEHDSDYCGCRGWE